MYAQTCTWSYFCRWYAGQISNVILEWITIKVQKIFFRYLQGNKDYMLTYIRLNHLKVAGYTNSKFAGCMDSRNSTSSYGLLLIGEEISRNRGITFYDVGRMVVRIEEEVMHWEGLTDFVQIWCLMSEWLFLYLSR